MASGQAADGLGSCRAIVRKARPLHRRSGRSESVRSGSFRASGWRGLPGSKSATPDVPRHRWRQFVDDCNGFLNSPEAERAAQLGWHTIALFGCKPSYPLSYLGQAGLLWHVNGGKIIEIHRTWAVIDGPVNRSPRRPQPPSSLSSTRAPFALTAHEVQVAHWADQPASCIPRVEFKFLP
jgi:hypothetical protein